jgi:hypothetical protein
MQVQPVGEAAGAASGGGTPIVKACDENALILELIQQTEAAQQSTTPSSNPSVGQNVDLQL